MTRTHTLFALSALLVAVVPTRNADAQTLLLKRALTTSAAPGCAVTASDRAAPVRRDNAEARRLAAAGQEAALVGDQRAARDAFKQAASLNPGDDRIAYDLGRANEELADTLAAVAEYCRYLTLSPDGREAADVRARLPRLIPLDAARAAEQVQILFRRGIVLYDGKRYDVAASAFDSVVRTAPQAIEATYNRGLARAAIGRRPEALKDFEAYVAAAPVGDDRTNIARAIDALRRPVYSPGVAFARGILPGFGQLYTGRPVRGIVVIGLVAGAAVVSIHQTTGERQVAYTDPNGQPAPYNESFTERPYFTAGVGAAVGLTLIAAIEASVYAKRTRSKVLQTGAVQSRDRDVAFKTYVAPDGRLGLKLSTNF